MAYRVHRALTVVERSLVSVEEKETTGFLFLRKCVTVHRAVCMAWCTVSN